MAVLQHATIVQNQRRYARQRIVGPDLVGIAEGGPWFVLERQPVERQCNSHAPDERGIILTDQDHGTVSADAETAIDRRDAASSGRAPHHAILDEHLERRGARSTAVLGAPFAVGAMDTALLGQCIEGDLVLEGRAIRHFH
jgi:hypothetical protein